MAGVTCGLVILVSLVGCFSAQATYLVTFNSDETEIIIDLSGHTFTESVTVTVDTSITVCKVYAGFAGSLCTYTGPLVPGKSYVVTIQNTAILQTNTLIKAPSPPTSVTINVQLTTKSSLTVSWTTDSTSRDGFLLHVDRTDGILTNISISDESKRKHTIASLLPGREYSIGARSVSYGVLSDATRASTTYTYPETPDVIKLEALDTNTLSVEWTPKATSTQSSFETQCRLTPDGSSWMTVPCTGADNTCLIDVEQVFIGTSVKAGMPYYVRVCAVRPGLRLVCTFPSMDANTKPKPPTDLHLQRRTTGSLTVRWTVASDTVLDGYEVTVNGVVRPLVPTVVSTRLYQLTIDDLDSGKWCTIHVVTVSGKEKSSQASASYYTVPPKPPVPTRAAGESTARALAVTWDAPTQQSAEFDRYSINITRVGGSSDPLQQQVVQSDADKKATFSDLTPGAEYTVSLGTVVSDVHSEPATANFYTKPLPPQNLLLVSRSSSMLSVKWDPPSDGEFDKYTVKVVLEREVAKSEDRVVQFDNLQAGKPNDVILHSLSGDGQKSEEVRVQIYTAPNPPTNVQLKEDSLSPVAAILTWDPPEDDGGGYDGYRLTPRNTLTNTNMALIAVNKALTEYTWTGLDPSNSYNLKVQTVINTNVFSSKEDIDFTTKPNPPRAIQKVSRSETSLDFTWSAPAQTVAVDRYEYSVTKQGGDTGTVNTVTTLTARQESLTPGAKYTIRVLAVKSEVKSDLTSTEDFTVPADVGRLYKGTNTPTSVQVMWTEPQQVSVFDGFEVTWRLAGSSTQLGKETVDKSLLLKELTGLTSGENFRVTVRTMSNGLFSRGISQDVSTQPPELAGLVPKDIKAQSIKVSWKKPIGAVNSYDLNISPNDGGIGLPVNVAVTGQTQEYTFLNLFPGRTYTLSIVVVSPSSKGAAVNRIVTTRPLPVEQFAAAASGESTIRLSWSTSSSTQNKFVITYGDQPSITHVPSSTWQQHTRTISGLKPGSTTAITVQPFSGVDSHVIDGAKSTVTQTTVPARVTNLRVKIVSAKSAQVSWDPAAMSIQDKYQVRYQTTSTGVWSTWEEVLAPTLHKDIDQLFPGLEYRFAVVTQSKRQQSSEISAVGTTYPLPPDPVTADRTMTTVDSVLVKWEYNDQVNHVTHWNVTFTVKGSSAWKVHTYYPLPVSTTETTIGNLVSGQNYTVCVYSLTAGNVPSETCTSTVATVKPSQLSAFREVLEKTTTTQVVAEYIKPSGSGVFDRYVFSINAATDTNTQNIDYGSDSGEIIFPGLTPGSHYRLSAMTVSGLEESDKRHVDTVTVPLPPSLRCIVDRYSLVLNIIKPSKGEADTYEVECSGNNCFTGIRSVSFVDDITSLPVNGLSPNNSYEFKVTSRLQQKKSELETITCETGQDKPGPVTDFSHTNLKPYEVTLLWKPPQQSNGLIKEYVINYRGTKQGKSDHVAETIHISVSNPSPLYIQDVTDLRAGFVYLFKIHAVALIPGVEKTLQLEMPVKAPFIVASASTEPRILHSDDRQITLEFPNPFSDVNGEVSAYSIIVYSEEASNRSVINQDITTTWTQAQTQNPLPPYAAIYKCADLFDKGDACWSMNTQKRRRRAVPGERVQVKVGADTTCNEETTHYCNGPLRPGTNYRAFLRGYSELGEFSDGIHSKPLKPGSGSETDTVVIAVVVVVILLALISLGIVLLVLHRKGKICQKGSSTEHDANSNLANTDAHGLRSGKDHRTAQGSHQAASSGEATRDLGSYEDVDFDRTQLTYQQLQEREAEYYNTRSSGPYTALNGTRAEERPASAVYETVP